MQIQKNERYERVELPIRDETSFDELWRSHYTVKLYVETWCGHMCDICDVGYTPERPWYREGYDLDICSECHDSMYEGSSLKLAPPSEKWMTCNSCCLPVCVDMYRWKCFNDVELNICRECYAKRKHIGIDITKPHMIGELDSAISAEYVDKYSVPSELSSYITPENNAAFIEFLECALIFPNVNILEWTCLGSFENIPWDPDAFVAIGINCVDPKHPIASLYCSAEDEHNMMNVILCDYHELLELMVNPRDKDCVTQCIDVQEGINSYNRYISHLGKLPDYISIADGPDGRHTIDADKVSFPLYIRCKIGLPMP